MNINLFIFFKLRFATNKDIKKNNLQKKFIDDYENKNNQRYNITA